MPGLFSTPEETYAAQSQLQDQQARGYAALGADNAGAYLGMRAGQQIGGLLSGPDPAMQRSYLVQDALKEVNASDSPMGTPKYFDALVKALSKRNLTNDALSVTDYAEKMRGERAKSGLAEAATKKDEAEADQHRAILDIYKSALPGAGAAATQEPEQLSGPGAFGGAQAQPGIAPAYRNPDLLRAASLIPGMAHLGTEAEHIEKKAELDRATTLAKDPETGLFSSLISDPYVGKIARQQQANLTAGKTDYMHALNAYNSLSLRAVAMAGAAGVPATTEHRASAAAQIAAGTPLIQVYPGMGKANSDKRDQGRNDAIDQIKNEMGLDDIEAGKELSNRQIAYLAGRKSVGQLTTMLGSTRQNVYQLDFNVDKVSEAMKKLPSSDLSPIINAIARGEQKWTGNPAYSELYYYMHAALMESAKIVQGASASIAQLHQGAAEEARKWADANMTTPAAWNQGVAPAMKTEGRARLATFERAIGEARIGSPVRANPNGQAVTVSGPDDPKYQALQPGDTYFRPGSNVPWKKQ